MYRWQSENVNKCMWEAAPLLWTLFMFLFCALQKRMERLGNPEPCGFSSELWSPGHLCYCLQGDIGSPPSLISTFVAALLLFAELNQRFISQKRSRIWPFDMNFLPLALLPHCRKSKVLPVVRWELRGSASWSRFSTWALLVHVWLRQPEKRLSLYPCRSL